MQLLNYINNIQVYLPKMLVSHLTMKYCFLDIFTKGSDT